LKLRLVFSALCLLLGCGKPIVSGNIYEEKLLSASVVVRPEGALTEAQLNAARIGVLWTDPSQKEPDVVMPAGYLTSKRNLAASQPTFDVDVFRPPPSAAILTMPSPSKQTASLAIGEIVLFLDGNGDNTFRVRGRRASLVGSDRDEFLGSSTAIIRYIERPFAETTATFPFGPINDDQRGYDLVILECQGPLPAAPPTRSPNLSSDRPNTFLISVTVQPSTDLPEVRTCMRTHSP
jgi:hypothetical protein